MPRKLLKEAFGNYCSLVNSHQLNDLIVRRLIASFSSTDQGSFVAGKKWVNFASVGATDYRYECVSKRGQS
jgi:hypothetical protein